MIFLSPKGLQRIVVKSATLEFLKVTGSDGVTPRQIPGLTIQFREMSGLGGRGGMLSDLPGFSHHGFRGIYETDIPAEITGLLDHAGYGKSFVGLSDDGSGMIDSDEQFVPLSKEGGKERWMCILNGKIFKSRAAVTTHKKTPGFKELLKEREERALEGIKRR